LTGKNLLESKPVADAEILFDNLRCTRSCHSIPQKPKAESPSTSPLAKMCAPGQKVLVCRRLSGTEKRRKMGNPFKASLAGVQTLGWSIVDRGGNKSAGRRQRHPPAAMKNVQISRRIISSGIAKFKVNWPTTRACSFMWRISKNDGVRKNT